VSATIIDGKKAAAELRLKVAAEAKRLKALHGLVPGLATVLVGDDEASRVYVRNKGRTAEKLGFKSLHFNLPGSAPEADVLARVRALNDDKSVHGILVQMPLPAQVREAAVLDTLDPGKDVDALTPTNAGLLMGGRAHLVSCTPLGVMMLIKEYLGDIAGKDALVIGRQLLFGKPAAQLLLAANATVTMAHSKTRDLKGLARRADILLAAIGRPRIVEADWIKPGAAVFDVGINRLEENGEAKIVGDVDYEAALAVAGAITPVPGGVGAMTISCLMRNTLVAATTIAGLPPPNV